MAPVTLWQKICAGLFVVLVSGVWLFMNTSLHGDQQGRSYHTLLDQSVKGLAPSSLVCYNGIAVGKVQKVRNDFQHNKVRVDIQITNPNIKIFADYRIGNDLNPGTRAHLVTSFVTGIQYIDLTGGYSNYPTLPEGQIIPAESGANLDKISAKATQILDKVDKVFSQKNREYLRQLLDNLNAITANVNQQLVAGNHDSVVARINRLLANAENITGNTNQRYVQRTLENITQSSADLHQTIGKLRPQIDKALTGLDRLIIDIDKVIKSEDNQDLTSLVRQLNQIFAENRRQLQTILDNLAKFSDVLTEHLTALSQKIQGTLRNLDYLINKELSATILEFKRALYDVRGVLSILKAKPNALFWGSEVKGK